jgi:CheY-like chemotaxis protein
MNRVEAEAPRAVLLIEDDEVDQERLRRILRPQASRFRLTVVADAHQALALVQNASSAFAFILLDLHLPGMDGFEFLRHFHQQPHHQASVVIVLTGFHNAEERRRAQEYQIAAYLLKDELDPAGTQLLHFLTTLMTSPL